MEYRKPANKKNKRRKQERFLHRNMGKILKKLQKAAALTLAAILPAVSIVPAVVPAVPVMASMNKEYLNITEAHLFPGDSLPVKACSIDRGGKVTWKSSNPSVVTVSSTGTIKAKKAGSATITATVKYPSSNQVRGTAGTAGNILECRVFVMDTPQMKKNVTIYQGTRAFLRFGRYDSASDFKSANENIVSPVAMGTQMDGQPGVEVDAMNPGKTTLTVYFGGYGFGGNGRWPDDYCSVKPVKVSITVKERKSLINTVAKKSDAATRSAFQKLGYKIKLRSPYKQGFTTYLAGLSRKDKTLTLTSLWDDTIYYEMGFFVAAATNSVDTAEFKKIYAQEKKRIKDYTVDADAPLTYFARVYAQMVNGDDTSSIPKTTAYIKKTLKKMSTLSTATMKNNISKVNVDKVSVVWR